MARLWNLIFDLLRRSLALNLNIVAKVLGVFLFFFSFMMLLPPLVQKWMGEPMVGPRGEDSLSGFLSSALVGFVLGALLWFIGRRSKAEFFRREGILSVALVWFVTGVLGGLPFYLTGVVAGPWDGIFESVSGLTTTGSSVMGGGDNWKISELPTSILFWRSLLHWLGGIGIVVMFLVFLPALGITEKKLFQAEISGVSKEGVKPRIRESAIALVRIYLFITSCLFLAYWAFGMNLFDAVCHSFATIATGGFSTKDYSIGEFQNLAIEVTVIVGMLMAATNFSLYHRFVITFKKGRQEGGFPSFKELFEVFWKDPEFRTYICMFGGLVLLVTINLWLGVGEQVPPHPGSMGKDRVHEYASMVGGLRDASFQSASLISSTGFANSNLLRWPLFAQFLILMIMLSGGCSGSTGGGLKVARVLVLFKVVGRCLRRFIRPRSIEPLQLSGQKIDNEVAEAILALFILWILVLVFGSLALVLLYPQADALSAFTSIVTCLCNMGPGLTQLFHETGLPAGAGRMDVSSFGNYGAYPDSVKAMMAFIMILGRLEIYTPLIIFIPSFWKS